MRRPAKYSPARQAVQFIKYALLLLGVAAMAFPFYWMIITAFKPPSEALQFPPTLWPHQWTLDNYRQVWIQIPMGRYLLNSAFIASAVTLGVIASSALSAHAFVR